MTTDLLVGGVYHYWWGYYTKYGWLGVLFMLFFGVVLAASMVHYWHETRVCTRSGRACTRLRLRHAHEGGDRRYCEHGRLRRVPDMATNV